MSFGGNNVVSNAEYCSTEIHQGADEEEEGAAGFWLIGNKGHFAAVSKKIPKETSCNYT